jgi:hypothetical protein
MPDLVSAGDPERSAMFFPVSPRQGSGSDPVGAENCVAILDLQRRGQQALASSAGAACSDHPVGCQNIAWSCDLR